MCVCVYVCVRDVPVRHEHDVLRLHVTMHSVVLFLQVIHVEKQSRNQRTEVNFVTVHIGNCGTVIIFLRQIVDDIAQKFQVLRAATSRRVHLE